MSSRFQAPRFLFLIFFIGLAVVMQSCKDDDSHGNLEMVFKLEYDGVPMVAGEKYDYPLGFEFFVTKYSMFLSEVALLKGQSSIEVAEALFMDLAANQSTAAEAGVGTRIVLDSIPEGTYSSINMSIGLPSDLNATSPSDYTSSSPLSNTGEYWEGWSSYIFGKIEAVADLDGDGELTLGGANSEGLSYHMGTDEAYYEVTIPQTIELIEDVPFTIDLNVDLNEVFKTNNPLHDENGDGYLDVETFKGTHTADNLEVAKKLMSNLANSISLEF